MLGMGKKQFTNFNMDQKEEFYPSFDYLNIGSLNGTQFWAEAMYVGPNDSPIFGMPGCYNGRIVIYLSDHLIKEKVFVYKTLESLTVAMEGYVKESKKKVKDFIISF